MHLLHLEPPSTPPEIFAADSPRRQAEERRAALARLAWLIDASTAPALVVRWVEHRLRPLGVTDAAAALAAAQRAPWWPALYAEWAAWMQDRRRRRLVVYAYYQEQLRPGAEDFALVLPSQRAMIQDVGIADADAAVKAAQREPWWAALYAEEAGWRSAYYADDLCDGRALARHGRHGVTGPWRRFSAAAVARRCPPVRPIAE